MFFRLHNPERSFCVWKKSDRLILHDFRDGIDAFHTITVAAVSLNKMLDFCNKISRKNTQKQKKGGPL